MYQVMQHLLQKKLTLTKALSEVGKQFHKIKKRDLDKFNEIQSAIVKKLQVQLTKHIVIHKFVQVNSNQHIKDI